MLRKLEYICLIGSIGLMGADRIDLLLGYAPFTLTPFLVLAPLVLFLAFLRAGPRGVYLPRVTRPIQRQLPFLAGFVLFLLFAFASVALSLDPARSFVAFCDLLLVSALGYCISLLILAEPAPGKLILRSVTFALLIYLIFCIGESIAWHYGLILVAGQKGLEAMFAPGSLIWAPRLSGSTYDSNRACFVLVMYLALLDWFVVPSRLTRVLRFAIAFFVFLSLSRSGVLCWFGYCLFSENFWGRLTSRRAIAWLIVVILAGSVVGVAYRNEIVALAEVWELSDVVSARMSLDEGSSGKDHILLIERGLETWVRSPKTMTVGIGFASAPKVLDDFFGDDKHGNFHCLFVTVLAELGLPAFLVLMFLMGYPVISRTGTASCVAAMVIFNLSYQSHLEPLFWALMALLWSLEARDGHKLRSLALHTVAESGH
jgi:hypothetical protein